jgi:hypothetical protein
MAKKSVNEQLQALASAWNENKAPHWVGIRVIGRDVRIAMNRLIEETGSMEEAIATMVDAIAQLKTEPWTSKPNFRPTFFNMQSNGKFHDRAEMWRDRPDSMPAPPWMDGGEILAEFLSYVERLYPKGELTYGNSLVWAEAMIERMGERYWRAYQKDQAARRANEALWEASRQTDLKEECRINAGFFTNMLANIKSQDGQN